MKSPQNGVGLVTIPEYIQKAKFHPFHKDTVDESTLDALEKELDRLKKYHEVNLAIFSKVNEWQKAWEHVLQVRRCDNSNCLFVHH